MEAVVLRGPGDWSLETVDTPEVDAVENVLCKVRSAAICGTDPKIMEGKYDEWPPSYPFIPGHEWAAEVVAVHEDVDRFGPGDRVFGETHSGCGSCENCRRGRYNLCLNYGDFSTGHRQIGHTMDGAFAEYVTVPARSLYHLDEGISWREAALLDVNAIALQCTVRGNVEPGDTVAVVGTGLIGLIMVQQARAKGASEIIAVGNPRKNEMATDMGADHTISYRDDDVVEQVFELTDGVGADVTLEAVGIGKTVRQSVEMTRKGGIASIDGVPTDALNEVPVAELVKQEIDMRGNRAHANKAEASAELVRTGMVDLEPLITHDFELGEFEAAYAAATSPDEDAIRVVMTNE
jgi:L-iditol 2-dehydrogenase